MNAVCYPGSNTLNTVTFLQSEEKMQSSFSRESALNKIKIKWLKRDIFEFLLYPCQCLLHFHWFYSKFYCTTRCNCHCIGARSQWAPISPGWPCKTRYYLSFMFFFYQSYDHIIWLNIFLLNLFCFLFGFDKRRPEGCSQSVSDPPTYCVRSAGVLRYKRESDSQRTDLAAILSAVLRSFYPLL